MKKLSRLLLLASVSVVLNFNAQTNKTSGIVSETQPSETKLKFVANQDYLSKNSLKDYKNYFGDSLKGFDEKKINTELLAQGFPGWEIKGHMDHLKRLFIKDKYFLSDNNLIKPTTLGTGNPKDLVLNGNINTNNTGGGHTVGGGAVINVSPCVNEGFENTPVGAYNGASNSLAVSGWTLYNRTADGVCPPTSWINGASAFSIVSTPIINFPIIGTIPHSPLGGTVVARMNDSNTGDYQTNRMIQTFPVTSANSLFQFAYAGYYQDAGAGHSCCGQPGLYMKMYNCNNNPLSCSSLSLNPNNSCASSGTNYTVIPNSASWTNWQVKFVDLTPYIGGCITIEIYTCDCYAGGHYGTTFFDSQCGGQLLGGSTGMSGLGGQIPGPVSFCAGSGIAQISAPFGYASYQWVAPGPSTIAAPQGTMSVLTISNPVPGAVYSVQLVSPAGCQYVATNTIVFTQVLIAGVGTSSTCLNGASGSASVIGNGSGSGYNYLWTNSSNSVVGTQSVVNNLAAGVYSILLTGIGSSGCGSAVTTVTVNTAPLGVIPLLKPFCSGQAFLTTNGGTNFHWYNGLTPITGSAGAVANYTVTNPVNASIYYLSYTSNQGCQDSIQYTLLQSAPGILNVSNISWICSGGTNGTAMVSMTPAVGAPPGFNSYSILNSSSTTPAYSSSISGVFANSYTLGGLAAGNYTVKAFDGSCIYGTSFNVNPYLFNYSLSPGAQSVCPTNNTITANVVLTPTSLSTSLSQYSFTWSPTTFVFGGPINTSPQFILPTVTPGSSVSIVYSVVLTPNIIYCPVTRTLGVTLFNPPTPTIIPIPNMCDNGLTHQIMVTPTGGTFYTTNNNPSPIIGAGILNPASIGNTLGVNSFTYSILVNTCQAQQTATYEISHFNPANLTTTVSPQCMTNAAVNLMNIVQFTTNGTWSGPGVIGSSGNYNFIPSTSSLVTGVYTLTYNTTSNPNPATCPVFTTMNVDLTQTLTPLISPIAPFCTNATPFSLTVSHPGGNWGNPAVNALTGVLTPSSALSNSVVGYTVSIGPCVNTNTAPIFVSQFNEAIITGTVPNLCYNSNPFNLMSIVQSTTFGSWSGPGVAPNTNSFSPGILNQGIYTVVYTRSSTPVNICEHSVSITISLSRPPTPSIVQSGPYCTKNAAVQLSVSPNNGTWVNSSFLTNTGVFTPSLASVGNNAVQYVVGSNTCFTQQTKYLSVESFQSASIMSRIPNQCSTGSPINLAPFTQSGAGIWTGSGINGTSFNPATVGSGSFVLTYNTASYPSGLCPDQSTIAVNVFSLAPPALNAYPVVCNSNPAFQIGVSPLGGIFGDNFGAIGKTGIFNPAVATIGNNIITYSITSGPCVAYVQSTINVVKFVSAAFDKFPKEIYCKNSDELVNLDGFAHNTGGVWSGNGIVGLNHNVFNPNLVEAGLHVVTYSTNSIPSTSLCPDTKTLNIRVGDAVEIYVSTNTESGKGCAPFQVVFYPQTNVGKGTWDFGDGSETVAELNTSHVYTSPGTYTATFSYISTEGCPSKPVNAHPFFEVYENPVANFMVPDEALISSPDIMVLNQSTFLNTNKYQWKIDGATTPNPNSINLNFTAAKVGKYQITLIAETNKGCKNEISKTLEVKNDFNVYIPTSFSPNYDGLNDVFIPVFSPYGLDTKTYELEIFDRWGHSLFKTKDSTKGWDGSLQNKGETLKEDVFIFKVKFKDLDGNLYNKMGHLSLLR